jgi:hypothetical protein
MTSWPWGVNYACVMLSALTNGTAGIRLSSVGEHKTQLMQKAVAGSIGKVMPMWADYIGSMCRINHVNPIEVLD